MPGQNANGFCLREGPFGWPRMQSESSVDRLSKDSHSLQTKVDFQLVATPDRDYTKDYAVTNRPGEM